MPIPALRDHGASPPNVSSHSASLDDAASAMLLTCKIVHTVSRIGPTRLVVHSTTGSCR